mmetsp:Transcript_29262/g.76825  ORF Transcript_29262/g.76825 Transcript_29262/m.76825 type:complete len:202 (+) Transcript_29262:763-1368(+)
MQPAARDTPAHRRGAHGGGTAAAFRFPPPGSRLHRLRFAHPLGLDRPRPREHRRQRGAAYAVADGKAERRCGGVPAHDLRPRHFARHPGLGGGGGKVGRGSVGGAAARGDTAGQRRLPRAARAQDGQVEREPGPSHGVAQGAVWQSLRPGDARGASGGQWRQFLQRFVGAGGCHAQRGGGGGRGCAQDGQRRRRDVGLAGE